MTLAERLIHEGLIKGRQEGLTQGKTELVMHLLAVKFGELAERYRSRLSDATLTELDTWAERVLGAQTLDDVFVD